MYNSVVTTTLEKLEELKTRESKNTRKLTDWQTLAVAEHAWKDGHVIE